MEHTGFVVYNTFLKGYLNHDMCFSEKLAFAKIQSDECKCRTDIAILAKLYKDVPSFDEVNMEIRKVEVTIK